MEVALKMESIILIGILPKAILNGCVLALVFLLGCSRY